MRIGIDGRAMLGPRTGIARFLEGMLAALALIGGDHEFVLFAPKAVPFTPPNPRWRVRPFRGPKGTNGHPWLQLYGPWLLARERVDVFWGPMFLVPLASPVPAIVTVHDLVAVFYPETMEFFNYLALRTLLRPSLWRARHITADSRATADDVTRHMRVPRDKITVIYPGVWPEFRPRDTAEVRRRVTSAFGLSDPYILTVATLEPRKNLPTLMAAYAGLPASFRQQWPLVIAGFTGWKSASIHAAAKPLMREGSVRFLGYVSNDDLPWLYAGATLFLFPSFYEGFGLPVVEAMASGVPAAVSDIPVIREVAADSAWYVPTTDIEAWATAIRELVEDAGRRQVLREAGLRRAARFSFDESAQRLLTILERQAGGQSATEPVAPSGDGNPGG